MGTWKLNEAKSKLIPGMGKNMTVTYTEQKDNIKVAVVGVDKDGKPTHSVWVGKFDGKAYPLKGNLAYNSVAYKMVNDRTNHITALNTVHGRRVHYSVGFDLDARARAAISELREADWQHVWDRDGEPRDLEGDHAAGDDAVRARP